MHVYTKDFFEGHATDCENSAATVIPLVLSLLKPTSVIDVGCGDGTWLRIFSKLGIADFQGVDGDYVTPEVLRIPRERFRGHDLTKPLDLGRKFDLVTTLEVAEHLPDTAAGTFVDSLVRHSDLILFSASIPGQYGEHHVNEQWPSYWVELFRARGFQVYDIFRWRIWDDKRVSWWYRQNMMVYAKPERAASIPALAEHEKSPKIFPLNVAHPDFTGMFANTLAENASLRAQARKLMKLVSQRVRKTTTAPKP